MVSPCFSPTVYKYTASVHFLGCLSGFRSYLLKWRTPLIAVRLFMGYRIVWLSEGQKIGMDIEKIDRGRYLLENLKDEAEPWRWWA